MVTNDDSSGHMQPCIQMDSQDTVLVINNNEMSWKINRRSFEVERQIAGSVSQKSVPSVQLIETASNDLKDNTEDKFPRPGSRVSMDGKPHTERGLAMLTLGALGVVFGDIGTSPLYTVQNMFAGSIPADPDHIIGAISALFWLLNIVVTLKYVTLIMRADNHGQGGIMALTTLASRSSHELARPWWKLTIMFAGIFGATMFYGDSIVTPAISVMSALEGISVISPALTGKTMPIAIVMLILLFLIQRWGTGVVGRMFGPVMLLWFATLAIVGIQQIAIYPGILAALNPARAASFLNEQNLNGGLLSALGNIILAVTGGEALYADMGHFGPLAVRVSWLCVVLPGVSLNYLGQGALMISNPGAVSNPFYYMFPSQYMVPAVILSTAATVIASQSVIAGCYSLTSQAIKIGLLPRMEIRHMSATKHGRIYVPVVNWILMIAVVALCAGFQTSTNLASAYGMAVSMTMTIDGLLTGYVGSRHFIKQGWYLAMAPLGLIMACIFSLDMLLVSSCALKFMQGAWFPIIVGLIMFLIMSTWMRGTTLLLRTIQTEQPPLEPFAAWLAGDGNHRATRTAVYPVADAKTVPRALLQNLKHNQVQHENNLIVQVHFMEQPTVRPEQQIHVEELAPSFWRIVVNYGFKDHPDIPDVVARLEASGLPINSKLVTYFLARSLVAPSPATGMLPSLEGMALWRKHLYAFIHRMAGSASDYYCLPGDAVIELASQVVI